MLRCLNCVVLFADWCASQRGFINGYVREVIPSALTHIALTELKRIKEVMRDVSHNCRMETARFQVELGL